MKIEELKENRELCFSSLKISNVKKLNSTIYSRPHIYAKDLFLNLSLCVCDDYTKNKCTFAIIFLSTCINNSISLLIAKNNNFLLAQLLIMRSNSLSFPVFEIVVNEMRTRLKTMWPRFWITIPLSSAYFRGNFRSRFMKFTL